MSDSERRGVVLFLGSSVSQLGNDDLFHLLNSVLQPGEFVLVEYDLHKNSGILKSAFDSVEAVAANKRALAGINNHFEGDFDPEMFEFVVLYNPGERCCETHLRSEWTMSRT